MWNRKSKIQDKETKLKILHLLQPVELYALSSELRYNLINCARFDTDCLACLFDWGVKPDQDGLNRILAVIAMENNKVERAQLLLDNGANPYWVDSIGKTAYDYAQKAGHYVLVELFQEYKKSN